jgi:hypothetical protein
MRRFAIFALAAGFVAATAAQATPLPSGASAGAAAPRDRMICRRYLRTGSLADTYRTCKTRGEWDREQENVRQFSVSDTCRIRGEPSAGAHTQDC